MMQLEGLVGFVWLRPRREDAPRWRTEEGRDGGDCGRARGGSRRLLAGAVGTATGYQSLHIVTITMATTGALFIRRLRAESLRNIDIAMDEDTNIEHESEPCSFYVAGVPAVVFDTDPETSIKVSQSLSLHNARLTSLRVKLRKLFQFNSCAYVPLFSQSLRVYLRSMERKLDSLT